MMKNKTYSDFLALVRYALGGDLKIDGTIDWPAVLALAEPHGVAALIGGVIERLEPAMRPDMGQLMRFVSQTVSIEKSYARNRMAVEGLSSFYAVQGMPMMLLKGYGMSQYWPVPSHRPSGDIDIYLWDRWESGDRMVREKLGISVESGHEHHTTFRYKGIMVENHYDFINTKAHRDAPAIETELKRLTAKDLCVADPEIANLFYPSADFNAIFLIRHLGQHFAGEFVTLRQLLDWGLFLQKDGDRVNWTEVIPFLKGIGLWKFFNMVNAICADILGLRIDPSLYAERDEALEERILADIIEPEFGEEKPESGLVRIMVFKLRRWWHNRWKHPLVYDEWLLPMFLTLLWSKLRRIDTIKD